MVHPQNETYWECESDRAAVGVRRGETVSEAVTMAYHRYHQVDTRILSHLQYLRAADADQRRAGDSEFHVAGAAGKDLTVYGDGSQTRSFCYVSGRGGRDSAAGAIIRT